DAATTASNASISSSATFRPPICGFIAAGSRIERPGMTPKIVVVAGSIRTGAYSARTADAAMKELAIQGAEVTRLSLADYPLPIMDEDLEREKGIPDNAMRLGRAIAAHD